MQPRRHHVRRALLGAALALPVVLGAAPGAPARGLTLGIGEPDAFTVDPDEALLERMRATRAAISRGAVFWRTIAPQGRARPEGFDPRDPASRHYSWSAVDEFVRSTIRNGMRPLLALYAAPDWAQPDDGSALAREHRPFGTYRPSPDDYRDFAYAVARRYDGTFPDPARPGLALPRVRYFQAWNEPNFGRFLMMPDGERASASTHFVRLLNALYDGVKEVHRSNFVVTGGTGPWGFNGYATDVDPQLFLRRMFCLERAGRGLRRRPRCNVPRPRFDALAHHPYEFRGRPTSKGVSRDAGGPGNMGEIGRILRYAENSDLVAPRGRKELWVTEFGWFSNPPPNPWGKPLRLHARYTAHSLWHLWRSGVSTVIWYSLADRGDWPGGLYFADARPKPALEAFRLPFVAMPRGRRLELWGALASGGPARVEIERASGGSWRRTVVVDARRDGIFRRVVGRPGGGTYRARVLTGRMRGAVSQPFSARRP